MQIVNLGDHLSYVGELAKLHHKEWAHLSAELTLNDREKLLLQCCREAGIPFGFIALDGKKLSGSAFLVEHDMSTRRDLSPWLAGVYVKETYRGQGIASELVHRVEMTAIAYNVQTMYLYTQFASALYKKLGWSSVERCHYRGVQVEIMCKSISA
jgi:GNAT superfamily N-acetyltransferase